MASQPKNIYKACACVCAITFIFCTAHFHSLVQPLLFCTHHHTPYQYKPSLSEKKNVHLRKKYSSPAILPPLRLLFLKPFFKTSQTKKLLTCAMSMHIPLHQQQHFYFILFSRFPFPTSCSTP